MSPRPIRYPSPASGDDAKAGGRHRRPDSAVDVVVPRAPRVGRHSFGVRAGVTRARPGTAGDRRPFTGVHRAPGTLPIETWLLTGRRRPQVLLASLVAIALLVVALPAQQRRDGIDAVNSAAERAVGARPQKQRTSPAPTQAAKGKAAPAGAADQPAAKASTTPSQSAGVTPADLPTLGRGPGRSLRTTGSRAIALTFDDGPDPVQTPKILAMLAEYQLKATFCLVGQQVQKHPEIVREIVAAGHTLCNHTWNHSLTIGQDKPEQIAADLNRTSAAIRAAEPNAEIPFFRAPGGNFTDRLVTVAAAGGMASLYWQVDPQDWRHPIGETDAAHVARVIADVRKHVKPGSIILSHDFNQPDTIEAYAELLPWLKQNFQIGLPTETTPSAKPTTATPTTTPTTAPTTAPTGSPTGSPTATEPAPADPATSAPATADPAAAE